MTTSRMLPVNDLVRAVPVLALLTIFSGRAIATEAPEGAKSDASTAAATLLQAVGGKAAWGSDNHILFTQQRAYLTRTGEIAMISIWRNLDNYTRLIKLKSSSRQYSEYIGTDSGWRELNGSRSDIAPEQLEIDQQGLRQSPYYIYRRLALADSDLSLELVEDGGRLNVSSPDGTPLCWFLLDGRGSPVSWGNIFNGSVSQHYYGPLIRTGDASFPKWGAAIDGSWRFEYIFSLFSDDDELTRG